MYDEDSPRFNEIFVQPSPTKITDYKFDIDRGDSYAKELPQDIDRKLIGFESVDELFSAIQPHPKPEKEHPSLHSNQIHQNIQQVPPSKKPTITINYSKPQHISPRNSTVSPPSGPLFRPVKSPQMRVRKVIEYEQRMVRVPVQRQIVEFTTIQEIPEPSETRLQERPLPLGIPRTRSIDAINPKPIFSLMGRQDRTLIGTLPRKQDLLVKRFVTSQGYNYQQRKRQLEKLHQKMLQLRQIQKQLFGT